MALSPSDNLITHKKVSSEVSPVNCGDWNANHDIKNLMGYILVEERVLPAGTTSTTFSNLDGDTDEEYLIETDIIMARTGVYTNLILRPNGDTNSTYNGVVAETLNNVNSAINAAFIWIASTGNSQDGSVNGECKLYAKSGKIRHVIGEFVCSRGTYLSNDRLAGNWSNTTDNITSIVLLASDSGSFSGTIRLWKKIPVEV